MKLITQNENRPGYKETKIGWIPEEWEIRKIKETGSVVTGSTPVTNDRSNYGSDHLFVTPVDLGYSKYISKSERMISEKGFNSVRNIPKGSILFTCIGSTIGKVGVSGCVLATNQQINSIVVNGSFSNEFLFYSLFSYSDRIKMIAGNQAVPIISKSIFENLFLSFPPLLEQKKIAAILSTWDKAIEKIDALIKAKEQQKKGLMQKLLTGKERFQGFTEPWKEVRLGDVCIKMVSGGTPSTNIKKYWTGKIPWITGADFIDGKIGKIRRFITDEAVQNSATSVIKKDDILMVTRTGVGKITIAPFNIAISQDMTGITPNIKIIFKDYLLSALIWSIPKLIRKNQGTSINGVTRGDLKTHYILLPTLREQQKIASVLSACDKEITLLNKEKSTLEQQKKGLMQKLLTGNVRVGLD